jgi:microsomal dipeptidase-like Zn-dependent dipeptidase
VIVDLHAHYPMHLVPGARVRLLRLLRSGKERRRLRDWLRALLVGLASLVADYRSPFSGPRVRVSYMRAGGVGVALSVLYSFFDEVDVVDGAQPRPGYLESIEGQLEVVESHIAARHRDAALIAHNPGELNEAQRAGRLALVHCVEGGFHLGSDPREIDAAVHRLAGLGVAYITLAHLIWRGVATDAPALPFMTDAEYRHWLPQPQEGLSNLGRAAIKAMVRERVLVDVSHMSERSLEDTFALLDRLDPDRSVPVLATHAGYRFGAQEYMLQGETLRMIAERNGVVGLIFAQHQLNDGLSGPEPRRLGFRIGKRRRFERSFEVLCRHIDRIREVTGSHRHTAIGSDLDGFIKPTLAGLEDMRNMAGLERALRERYGEEDGELICSGNSLRVLMSFWGGGRPGGRGLAGAW